MDQRAPIVDVVGSKTAASRRNLHVDEAGGLAARSVRRIRVTETIPLRKAAGRVLSASIRASIPVPPFDHSAVDGFGVRSEDALRPETSLPVTASILAGSPATRNLDGATIRVMTGAPIPPGCDAVVKLEHVIDRGSSIILTDTIRRGANIRRVGEDVAAGAELAGAGTLLDTRHIALLAACGIPRVQVVRRVRIAIVAFGNELRRPGFRLCAGQIFDSNSLMAMAFLSRGSCQIIERTHTGDNRERVAELLRDLADDADLIVTSGGMAAGDADYTRTALRDIGGYWKEAAFNMKPGRPALLGRIGNTAVLGLPGNPFAALVSLLVLGLPIIDRLTGHARRLQWLPAHAGFELHRLPGHTEFFPARVGATEANGVLAIERLGKGGSARLSPLVHADGLGRIDEKQASVEPGDAIRFLPFTSILG